MQFSLEEEVQGMIKYLIVFSRKVTINYPSGAEKTKNTVKMR